MRSCGNTIASKMGVTLWGFRVPLYPLSTLNVQGFGKFKVGK